MPKERRGDIAWRRLLEAKGIDLATADLPIALTMEELKTLGGREPRLMLSMDTRHKWPSPLREHGVFPLSNSTSTVVLVSGDGWFDLPEPSDSPREFRARLPFQLASSTIGRGENAHIMRLETSGFLSEFLGASDLIPVASGRRTTPDFTVYVDECAIQVSGAQYEIDGKYESAEDLVPIEMKTKAYGSCAIRQVYYPYRSTYIETEGRKPVRPLYITYDQSDDHYVVRELGFRDREVWDSIYQVQSSAVRLKLDQPSSRILDLESPELPYDRIPQADRVERIAEFPLLVARGINRSSVIADYFEFVRRQSSYYRDAVEMLGLVELDDSDYVLTPDGQRYVSLSPQGRADFLASRMSRLPVLRAVLSKIEDSGEQGLDGQSIWRIVKAFADERNQTCNTTTAKRRATTVRAFLNYIGSRTGALVRVGGDYYLTHNLTNLDRFDNLD